MTENKVKRLLIIETWEAYSIGCYLFAKPRFVLIRNNTISYSSFFFSPPLTITLQSLLSCSQLPDFPPSLREVPMGPKTLRGAGHCELQFVPVASKIGKEIAACLLALCKRVFQCNDALRKKERVEAGVRCCPRIS